MTVCIWLMMLLCTCSERAIAFWSARSAYLPVYFISSEWALLLALQDCLCVPLSLKPPGMSPPPGLVPCGGLPPCGHEGAELPSGQGQLLASRYFHLTAHSHPLLLKLRSPARCQSWGVASPVRRGRAIYCDPGAG